jgi:hypothetical protein
MLELTDGLKALLKETAERLKGHERRRFMAKTVEELGIGGQRLAERELGWHRDLIRKGKREVESGIVCVDAFELRGRKLTTGVKLTKKAMTEVENQIQRLTCLEVLSGATESW